MTRKSVDGLTDRQYQLADMRYRTLLRTKLQPTLAKMLIMLFSPKVRKEYIQRRGRYDARARGYSSIFQEASTVVIRFTTSKQWRDIAHVDFYNATGELLLHTVLYLKLEEFTRFIYLCIGLVEFYGDSWRNHEAKVNEYAEKGIEVAMWDSVISHIQNHLTNVGSDLIIDVNAHVAHVEHHDGTVRFPLTA